MNALRKLALSVGAAGAAVTLLAGPVVAAESGGEEPAAETEQGGESGESEGRRPIAETPRDQVGLIVLGALVVGGGAAAVNARRQFKGERPQATGEFRWR